MLYVVQKKQRKHVKSSTADWVLMSIFKNTIFVLFFKSCSPVKNNERALLIICTNIIKYFVVPTVHVNRIPMNFSGTYHIHNQIQMGLPKHVFFVFI
jgi:hypothetical protein